MPIITSIPQASARLKAGALLAFPTETVYGLGADASNATAVAKIFAAKGRPANHPVIVHLADKADIKDWARDVPARVWTLLEQFTPGPLTVIVPKQPHVLAAVTGGQDTVGLRIPSHPVAQALLHDFAGGIAAPSANIFGHISPTSAAHVQAEFAEDMLILEGGSSSIGLESTIVDVSSLAEGGQARLLRPGHISLQDVCAVLGEVVDVQAPQANVPRASGTLARHYAPRTPCYLIDDFALVEAGDAVLAYQAKESDAIGAIEDVVWHRLEAQPHAYARQLYAALRQLDASGQRRILIQAVPTGEAWRAVADRLRRASQRKL